MDNEVESKLIFSPQLANFLLYHGYQIIKLKAKRNAENESVFVFRVDPGFYSAIDSWKSQNKE